VIPIRLFGEELEAEVGRRPNLTGSKKKEGKLVETFFLKKNWGKSFETLSRHLPFKTW
jgi:hypothetical protein